MSSRTLPVCALKLKVIPQVHQTVEKANRALCSTLEMEIQGHWTLCLLVCVVFRPCPAVNTPKEGGGCEIKRCIGLGLRALSFAQQ
jgi:hypothetical protein